RAFTKRGMSGYPSGSAPPIHTIRDMDCTGGSGFELATEYGASWSADGRRPRAFMNRAITPSWKSAVNRRGNRIGSLESAAQPEFGRRKRQRTKFAEVLTLISEPRQRIQWER